MDEADAEAWTTSTPERQVALSTGVSRQVDTLRPSDGSVKVSGKLSPAMAMQRWTAQTDAARHIEHLGECSTAWITRVESDFSSAAERRLASLKRTRSNGPTSGDAPRSSRLSRRHSDSGEYGNAISRRLASSPLASLTPLNEVQTFSWQDDGNAFTASDGEAEDKPEDEVPNDSDTACLLYNVEASASRNDGRQRPTRHQSSNTVTRSVQHVLSDSGHGGSADDASSSAWQGPHSRKHSRRVDTSRDGKELSSSSHARRPSILMPRPLRVPRNLEVSFDDGNSSNGRISFADNVRICGGIRSAEDEQKERSRRMSIRSTKSTTMLESMFTATSPVFYHGVGMGRPSHMGSKQPQPQFPVTFNVRRGSGPNSRPGSFYGSDYDDASTVGMHTSRASTPASLYAPLLLPSKTAPSPSRTFYLTFGGGTYRDLVRKQLEKVEARKRAKRSRARKQWWANLCTCGLAGRRKGQRLAGSNGTADDAERGHLNGGRPSEAQDDSDGDGDEQEALLRDLQAQLAQAEAAEAAEGGRGGKPREHTAPRREYKSEAEVMYGAAPWRWLRPGWWGHWIRLLTVQADSPDGG